MFRLALVLAALTLAACGGADCPPHSHVGDDGQCYCDDPAHFDADPTGTYCTQR